MIRDFTKVGGKGGKHARTSKPYSGAAGGSPSMPKATGYGQTNPDAIAASYHPRTAPVIAAYKAQNPQPAPTVAPRPAATSNSFSTLAAARGMSTAPKIPGVTPVGGPFTGIKTAAPLPPVATPAPAPAPVRTNFNQRADSGMSNAKSTKAGAGNPGPTWGKN